MAAAAPTGARRPEFRVPSRRRTKTSQIPLANGGCHPHFTRVKPAFSQRKATRSINRDQSPNGGSTNAMKNSLLLIGVLVGIVLSGLAWSLIDRYAHLTGPGGYYRSPVTPFYLAEDDNRYEEYSKLQNQLFWSEVSEHLRTAAIEYCNSMGVDTKVNLLCVGSATGYELFYSVEKPLTMFQARKIKGLEKKLVGLIDTKYRESLDRILTQVEQATPDQRSGLSPSDEGP